ncbi:hypothetical protein AB1Y20_001163 [Prymnesium parvum]|uniref:Toprim domain-containing protein n=1 Tax=Prymnesium parvum TaxID=97485 RepID=A0AB34KAT7_PRYPA
MSGAARETVGMGFALLAVSIHHPFSTVSCLNSYALSSTPRRMIDGLARRSRWCSRSLPSTIEMNSERRSMKSALADLKAKVDLRTVARASGLSLDERGFAYCPFHGEGKERTPSLKVDINKYHCFACDESGDVIKFVQEQEGLSFREAVEKLSEEYGVHTDGFTSSSVTRSDSEKALIEVHEEAATLYAYALTMSGAAPCANLLLERGVTNSVVKKFRLGFAPGGKWLTKTLLDRKHEPDVLLSSGLSMSSFDNKADLKDRYDKRLMIPITDAMGKVVGFGARTIPSTLWAEHPAKYINSAQSEIFQKSKLLFALPLARGMARRRRELVIVEGYMDAIALHAVGVENTVACMGVGLSSEQLTTCRQLIQGEGGDGGRLILNFDADDAGKSAVRRLYTKETLQQLASEGIDVLVASLPPGFKDADEYLRAKDADGGEAYRKEVLDKAMPWVQWLAHDAMSAYTESPGDPSAFVDAFRLLSSLLRTLPPSMGHSFYHSYFAKLLAQGDHTLQRRLEEDFDVVRQERPLNSILPQKEPPKVLYLADLLRTSLEIPFADMFVQEGKVHLHTRTCRKRMADSHGVSLAHASTPVCAACIEDAQVNSALQSHMKVVPSRSGFDQLTALRPRAEMILLDLMINEPELLEVAKSKLLGTTHGAPSSGSLSSPARSWLFDKLLEKRSKENIWSQLEEECPNLFEKWPELTVLKQQSADLKATRERWARIKRPESEAKGHDQRLLSVCLEVIAHDQMRHQMQEKMEAVRNSMALLARSYADTSASKDTHSKDVSEMAALIRELASLADCTLRDDASFLKQLD